MTDYTDDDLKAGIRRWANRLHVPMTRAMSRALREEIEAARRERMGDVPDPGPIPDSDRSAAVTPPVAHDLIFGPMGFVIQWPIGIDFDTDVLERMLPDSETWSDLRWLAQHPCAQDISVWCKENGITARLWPPTRYVKGRVTFESEDAAFAFKMRWM